eukprot:10549394-Alexandrium_andersonii.AAC.1
MSPPGGDVAEGRSEGSSVAESSAPTGWVVQEAGAVPVSGTPGVVLRAARVGCVQAVRALAAARIRH